MPGLEVWSLHVCMLSCQRVPLCRILPSPVYNTTNGPVRRSRGGKCLPSCTLHKHASLFNFPVDIPFFLIACLFRSSTLSYLSYPRHDQMKQLKLLLYRTMLSRSRDVVVGGHVFKMGNRWGKGKGGCGERKGGGEVSTQATWDQGGRESHHTQRRDSK